MKRFWRFTGEKGEISVLVVVTLSLISTLGLLALRTPEATDQYNESLRNIRNGEPTNENMTYVSDALGELADAAGGLPIPTDPGDVFQIGATYMIEDMVRSSSQPIPDQEQGYGASGQRIACGMSVDKASAEQGEFVTATITIPRPFQSKVSHISGEAGRIGFSVPKTGGTYVFSIPQKELNPIRVSFDAYAFDGGIACSGAVTVSIKLPSDVTVWVFGYLAPPDYDPNIYGLAKGFSMPEDRLTSVYPQYTVVLGKGLTQQASWADGCPKISSIRYAPTGTGCSWWGFHGIYQVCADFCQDLP